MKLSDLEISELVWVELLTASDSCIECMTELFTLSFFIGYVPSSSVHKCPLLSSIILTLKCNPLKIYVSPSSFNISLWKLSFLSYL